MKPRTPAPTPKPDTAHSKKAPSENGIVITLRLRPEHLTAIDSFAKRKGISRAAAIQLAVSEMLERNGLLPK